MARVSIKQPILVTGGCGFIGSHLVDRLVSDGHEVSVVDNMSSGSSENLRGAIDSGRVNLITADLLERAALASVSNFRTVFHLAANPSVPLAMNDPATDFSLNVVATMNLLESLAKNPSEKSIIFTSTSAVYGEPSELPTPEDYGPLQPISFYGADKLAAEAIISASCHASNLKGTIFRMANVVGPRSKHGVVVDLIRKFAKNPNSVEILGDGRQSKSYLHISDCIDALLMGPKLASPKPSIFNIGSDDSIEVRTIAKELASTVGSPAVRFTFSDNFSGRGWKGDVKKMLLDCRRMKTQGWKCSNSSLESIRLAIKEMGPY